MVKSDGLVTWSWAVVATPLFVACFLALIFDCLVTPIQVQMGQSEEEQRQIQNSASARRWFAFVMIVLLVAFVGMLVQRLDLNVLVRKVSNFVICRWLCAVERCVSLFSRPFCRVLFLCFSFLPCF